MFQFLIAFFRRIVFRINYHAENQGYPYKAFGIFGLIIYPVCYVVWKFFDPLSYENFIMRFIACVLCIFLVFEARWPRRIKKLLPLYWYFTLTYSLSFLFTFFLFQNGFSYGAVLNTFGAMVLCILLLDLIPLLVVMFAGGFLGWVFFWAINPVVIYPNIDYLGIVLSCMTVVIFGIVFAHKKNRVQQERFLGMTVTASSLAHELRTPLASVRLNIEAINSLLPALIDGYQYALQKNQISQRIGDRKLELLTESVNNISSEVDSAFSFVDILLMNVRQPRLREKDLKPCSLDAIVCRALQRYPFQAHQSSLVHYDGCHHFWVKGDEALLIHVIFNLLKNALYSISSVGKGEIWIWLKVGEGKNYLHFKDTGKGISEKKIKRVFERFYSTTPHGAGVGLAFCKLVMRNLGGDIVCCSVEGEFTEFILSFPKLENTL